MTSKRSLAKDRADRPERRLFGRRSGKALNKSRADAIEQLLPALSIHEEQLSASISINSLYKKKFAKHVLEIGFGTGEHLHGMMQRDPETAFIGVEPFLNGMATFLRDIKDMPLNNIRVLMDDAMLLVHALEDACLDEIYILNPDPWHKKRHHKRRIIREENLDQFSRVLKPGGRLISSTDVPYLAEWILEKTNSHQCFTMDTQSQKDYKIRPDWWIDHKYASKGAKGASEMHYFIFHKN
ncbi:MAG: tRNA (guanosine(46)-N7)-methyltransferase TrmB [Pseudomonadota bacterium]